MIVGALPRHAGAGGDSTVPSEVTALTSAAVRACVRACTAAASERSGWKRGQNQALRALDGAAAFDGEVC